MESPLETASRTNFESLIGYYSSSDGSASSSSLPLDEASTRVQRSNSTRTIRPLPAAPASGRAKSIRRLPNRPLPAPPSPSSSDSPLLPTIAVIPPTPTPLISSHPEPRAPVVVTHPGPSTPPPAPPPKPKISLLTSSEALGSSAQDSGLMTPMPFDIPQAPTPTTARRKRMSKLRRHLGEPDIPADLVSLPACSPPHSHSHESDASDKTCLSPSDSDADRGALEITFLHPSPATADSDTSSESLSLSSDEEEEDDDDEEFEMMDYSVLRTPQELAVDAQEDFVWEDKTLTYSLPPPGGRRYSTRWIVEKGGQRWEDNDYADILNRLRAL